MNMRKILQALRLPWPAAPHLAAVQTVTLAVPGMDCPVCPITVKKRWKKWMA